MPEDLLDVDHPDDLCDLDNLCDSAELCGPADLCDPADLGEQGAVLDNKITVFVINKFFLTFVTDLEFWQSHVSWTRTH